MTGVNSPNIEVSVLALDNNNLPATQIKKPIIGKIMQGSLETYKMAVKSLNTGGYDLVHIQHEFGIFGGKDGSYILDFAKSLSIPFVVTFHTVLQYPTASQKNIIQELAGFSKKIIIMVEIAKDRLETIYGVDPEKVTVIPHGVPGIEKLDYLKSKKKLGLENSFVLLASNLISRNKGIEYVIDAMPKAVKRIPNLVFYIVGETHPAVKNIEGESYRQMLERLVVKHKLAKNVIFINKYLDLSELKTYLASSDVCITAYLDPQQITSGLLAYAIGAGKACISTPYIYAKQMLSSGLGILVPFRNSSEISKALIEIYKNPKKREHMEKRAYKKGVEMRWPRIAKNHIKIYGHLLNWEKNTSERLKKISTTKDPNPKYLKVLTDEVGIYQHAYYTLHEHRYGYSTDDNARALIVASALYKRNKSEDLLKLVRTFLSFLKYAQDKNGKFHTFLNFQREWVDNEDVNDPFGKAIWAMGYLLSNFKDQHLLKPVHLMLASGMTNLDKIRDIRAVAYSILGLFHFISAYRNKKDSAEIATIHLVKLADYLVNQYEKNKGPRWNWFESVMTYDNFRLPQALFAAYKITGNDKYKEVAEESLAFAKKCNFNRNGDMFDFVGQDGWFPRGGKKATYDQQPLEAAAAVDAYIYAYQTTNNKDYLNLAEKAFEWFYGRNRNSANFIDDETGGVYDGLTKAGINQNEGAESVICFLLAQISLQELKQKNIRKG